MEEREMHNLFFSLSKRNKEDKYGYTTRHQWKKEKMHNLFLDHSELIWPWPDNHQIWGDQAAPVQPTNPSLSPEVAPPLYLDLSSPSSPQSYLEVESELYDHDPPVLKPPTVPNHEPPVLPGEVLCSPQPWPSGLSWRSPLQSPTLTTLPYDNFKLLTPPRFNLSNCCVVCAYLYSGARKLCSHW